MNAMKERSNSTKLKICIDYYINNMSLLNIRIKYKIKCKYWEVKEIILGYMEDPSIKLAVSMNNDKDFWLMSSRKKKEMSLVKTHYSLKKEPLHYDEMDYFGESLPEYQILDMDYYKQLKDIDER
jgi:hypothetical protein